MSETNQRSVSEFKHRIRNFAACYAILVPVIGVVVLLSVGVRYAAWILVSCLVIGAASLFGQSVRGARRSWVLIGMAVSGVFGGIAIFGYWVSVIGHQ